MSKRENSLMDKKYYIGVMSGTSLDGIDLALVDFAKSSPHVVATHFYPMPKNLHKNLTALLQSGETSLQNLGEIDHQLGLVYAESINHFLSEQQLTSKEIQAIGCHGQTIWHAPQEPFPFTMQIGDANIIAAKTSITTIADFRRKDMAYGGQGAPLVPAFHQEIFSHPERATVVLNIGGISNISCLIPDQKTIGYDTGPGNALMDEWIAKHLGQPYDKNAQWAKTGKVNTHLLDVLLDEPYFSIAPPKSTGRELFNLNWLEKKLKNLTALLPQDVQATLAELTVQCTARQLKEIEKQTHLPCLLLVCGGGAKNPLIMQGFKKALPNWTISTTTEYGLDIDYVEAAAFAWLAYQRMNNLPSNLPSVTNAKSAVSLGVIYPK